MDFSKASLKLSVSDNVPSLGSAFNEAATTGAAKKQKMLDEKAAHESLKTSA